MADFIDYIRSLSAAGLVLHLAFAVLGFVIIVYILPLGGKSKSADYGTLRNGSTARKNKGWIGKGKAQDSRDREQTRKAIIKSKPAARSWFRRSRDYEAKPAAPVDPKSVNATLDFIQIANPDVKKFKHPKATDYFKQLVKPGPAMNPAIPDLDDMDMIFTTMLKAGAVKGKEHLVTNYEHHYLEKLRIWFGDTYHIFCQVSVGSTVTINADVSELTMPQRRTFAQKCHNMSFDFMLVRRDTDEIACAIELDDPTHNRIERKMRDRRLDKVCQAAGIPIFHITEINQKPDLSRIRR